jgi:hypothetical protein
MQTEPIKAEPPKRKRRWFQFSLRALMALVTPLVVVCGYVGWQAKICDSELTCLPRSEAQAAK